MTEYDKASTNFKNNTEKIKQKLSIQDYNIAIKPFFMLKQKFNSQIVKKIKAAMNKLKKQEQKAKEQKKHDPEKIKEMEKFLKEKSKEHSRIINTKGIEYYRNYISSKK